ncbi:hypothetical protein ACQP1P_25890 [Dactylosporangium sp. CA-052675]|uniref:Orn/Lys/Arg family decarboxylase n=1 Tax=Dactylosporangium sp. CA-052675 TaxID=3239927 RepID=UPI003D8BCFD0
MAGLVFAGVEPRWIPVRYDTEATASRLVGAVRQLVAAAPGLPRAKRVELPSPSEFEPEPVVLPRDAFFGPAEHIPVARAVGRVCAEQVTPYPPGIPALIPGERISAGIVDYLRSGLAAGMIVPDAADTKLDTVRVVA